MTRSLLNQKDPSDIEFCVNIVLLHLSPISNDRMALLMVLVVLSSEQCIKRQWSEIDARTLMISSELSNRKKWQLLSKNYPLNKSKMLEKS